MPKSDNRKSRSKREVCLKFTITTLRGSSYRDEVAWLDRLARLSEISPSLRNSNKNIMCSYEKWASAPRWDPHRFCEGGKLFELFCIENDFPRYFAKCSNLFKYFVAHMTVIEMMRSNQIWPQDESNLNQINKIIFMRYFWFTIPSEIIWSWIIFNTKQLLKKDNLIEKTAYIL